MGYFTEIQDYKTYNGKDDDFHFIYNANTGGGQSFLGGKFRDGNGNLTSSSILNGRTAIFQFEFTDYEQIKKIIILNDEKTQYEIKPRAEGESSMKLGVANKIIPSKVIAAFLMLPMTCNIKKAENLGKEDLDLY